MHCNDHDVFGVTGKDSWSIRAEGRLRTPEGEMATYTGRIGCVVNRATWKCTDSVLIH